jgi:HEAT repeat protein
MNEGTLPGQFVPSILLDPGLVPPDTAAAALSERMKNGSEEERETAAWMVPYLASDAAWPAVEQAANDPDPRVRHAAEWALERRTERPARDRNAPAAEAS